MDNNLEQQGNININAQPIHEVRQENEHLNEQINEQAPNLAMQENEEQNLQQNVNNQYAERLANTFRQAKSRRINAAAIRHESSQKSVTRVVKKHLIKKDETVTENIHYYGTGKQLEEKRKENAKNIKLGSFRERDVKAAYRRRTDISVKKECGYSNFQLLSQFYPFMKGEMTDEAFNNMVKDYGKQEDTEGRYRAMDQLTAQIMKIDPSNYTLATDEDIAKQSADLDNLCELTRSYRFLMEDNAGYLETLKNKKIEGSEESYYDRLQKQMEMMTAISDYYKVRKMIISDSEYIASKGDIEQDIKETDSRGTKHLKEMLRVSFRLAARLNKVMGAAGVELPVLADGLSDYAKKQNKALDDVFAKDAETEEEKKVWRDTLEKLERENECIASLDIRDCLGTLYDIDKKKMSPYALAYSLIPGGTMDLQRESYTREKYTQPAGPNVNEPDFKTRLRNAVNKKKNNEWLPDLKFKSNKYPLMEINEAYDNFERSINDFPGVLMDDLSDEEVLEHAENIMIADSNEYKQKLNDDNYKDETDYYEDALAEVHLRSASRYQALTEQLDQALGMRFFVLHRADYAKVLPQKVINLLIAANGVTNVIETKKGDQKAFYRSLTESKVGKRSKYKLDGDRFVECGDTYANSLSRLDSNGTVLSLLTYLYNYSILKNEVEFRSEEELLEYRNFEKRVGTLNITKEQVEECYNAHRNDPEIAPKLQKLENVAFSPSLLKLATYIFIHPEFLTDKMRYGISPGNTAILDNPECIKRFRKNGMIKPISKKEVKDYETSLKKRKLNPSNIDSFDNTLNDKNDLYGLKVIYDIIDEENAKKKSK